MNENHKIKTLTIDDIIREGNAHTEKLRSLIKFDSDCVSLKWGDQWLHYEGNPMRNADSFVNLLDHLIDERWVTRDHLEALVHCFHGDLFP